MEFEIKITDRPAGDEPAALNVSICDNVPEGTPRAPRTADAAICDGFPPVGRSASADPADTPLSPLDA
jgi:hypothetical protein